MYIVCISPLPTVALSAPAVITFVYFYVQFFICSVYTPRALIYAYISLCKPLIPRLLLINIIELYILCI